MRKTSLLLCTLALSSSFAVADTFTFSGSGTGFTGGGTITAGPSGTTGVDDVTAISGTINGVNIGTLLPGSYDFNNPSTVNFFTDPNTNYTYGDFYDDLYYTSGEPLDEYGVAFTLADNTLGGLYDYNGVTYYISSQNYTLADINDPVPGVPLSSSTLAPTPEPSSLLLLGSGSLALFGVARRKLRPAAAR